MKKYLFILVLFPALLFGQNKTIDSLKLALKNAKHDTTRCNLLKLLTKKATGEEQEKYIEQLKTLAEKNVAVGGALKNIYRIHLAFVFRKIGSAYYFHADYAKALVNDFKSLKLAEEVGDKLQIGKTSGDLALVYTAQADYPKALEYFHKCLKLSEEVGDKQQIGLTLSNMAIVYSAKADFSKALESLFKALKLGEQIGDKQLIGITFGNIATLYFVQADYPKALQYFFKGLKSSEELGDKLTSGTTLGNIANVYSEQGNFSKALEYYFKGLKLSEEVGDKKQVGRTLGSIADLYSDQSDYPKALEHFFRSLKLSEEIGDKQYVGFMLSSIGRVFTKMGKYKEAELNLKKGLLILKKIGAEDEEKSAHQNLSVLYEKTNRPALALEHYKKFIALRDTIFSHENSKKFMRSEMDHEYQKQEAVAKAIHKKELENQQIIAEEKNRKQKIISMSVGGGLLLVLVFAGFIFRSLRITRKQKALIEKQKTIVEAQKDLVDEKQKEILDSIHYAKRIQTALITSEKYIERNLNKLNKG